MDKIYNYSGVESNLIGVGGTYIVKGIIHRGYNYSTSASGTFVVNNTDGAPENTLPAYILAAKKGFKYVETDVSFTSDGVPVLLHDETINRTSNGTGAIASLTLAQARSYKFNRINYSGVSQTIPGYDSVTIPTFEEFLVLCRNLSLHPYIELKMNAYTEAQVKIIVDMVEENGMKGNVTYISFDATYLGYVKNYDANARLGYLRENVNSGTYPLNATAIATAQALKNGENEVFIDAYAYSDAACEMCLEAGLPLGTWATCTPSNDTETNIIGFNPYITEVTSNKWDAGKVLYENAIGS